MTTTNSKLEKDQPLEHGWIYTGSSSSGDGCGYAILRSDYSNDARFAVRLRFDKHVALAHVESYNAAVQLGQDFMHTCRVWYCHQAREKALAQGVAVLGGA